jgi:hypothetical protein
MPKADAAKYLALGMTVTWWISFFAIGAAFYHRAQYADVHAKMAWERSEELQGCRACWLPAGCLFHLGSVVPIWLITKAAAADEAGFQLLWLLPCLLAWLTAGLFGWASVELKRFMDLRLEARTLQGNPDF